MIKNFTSKKKKKKTQKYTKTFFKKSSHTLKNKKHRVKINPTSISSNFVCVALWVNVKSLRIQILQKSQILAPLTTSPPRVNQATSKPTKPQFSTRPAIPRSVNPRFKQLCRCHPRRSQPHLSWSRLPISHGWVTSSSIFLCPNMGYCFPFTCCDFVNLLTILRWMFKESGEWDASYHKCWLFFLLFSIWVLAIQVWICIGCTSLNM